VKLELAEVAEPEANNVPTEHTVEGLLDFHDRGGSGRDCGWEQGHWVSIGVTVVSGNCTDMQSKLLGEA
jgi:hypothetical protein